MKNSHIIPTVFSHNKEEFRKRFERIVGASGKIQIDFMDGKFVSSKSVPVEGVPDLRRYRKEFEAHLMVSRPWNFLGKCRKKGFRRIIFHIEACKSKEIAERIINGARELGMQAYIAINPSTPLRKIDFFIRNEKKCDGILLLGVKPGKEGQKLSGEIPSRIRKIKRINRRMVVQVDGGVNDRNIGKLSGAGADYVNSGSFVSESANPGKEIRILESAFEKGKNKGK